MNLIVGAPSWLIIFLALCLLAAAAEDAARLRISNLTCVAIFAAALIAAAIEGFSADLWQNLVLCLGILAIGIAAFAMEWLGGGDVKLLAAIGLWLNLRAATALIASVFLAGGLVAVIYIVGRRVIGGPKPSRARSQAIPYGLAVVAGAAFVFGLQLNQHHINPVPQRPWGSISNGK